MTEKRRKSRSEIKVEVRQKIDCEEKAFRWVEHLALVDSISEEELAKVTSQVMLCHYNDITEERALSKICGYPLCNTKLGKRSSHKYHISTKHNKVIDLSIRENFCSLHCFQASKFIENQIPEDPIWLRDGKPLDLKFLENKSLIKECGIGEVLLPISKLNIEDDNDTETHSDDEHEDLHHDSDDEIDCKNSNVSEKGKKYNQIKFIDNKDIIKHGNTETQQYITKISALLKEWFTKRSYQHLNLLSDEFIDSDDDTDDEKEDYVNPMEDSTDFQNKVVNFLSRQPEWISESNVSATIDEEKVLEKKKSKYKLPTIDSKSQNNIRKRIVHEKFSSSLREVLPICGLLEHDLTQVGFFKLIDTFNFTSKNIVLNLKEWMVITLSLLKIMSKSYQKEFGSLKKRYDDINGFMIMRNLPNLSDIEKIIENTLEKTRTSNSKANLCKVEDRGNTCLVDEIDTSSYYDNMEDLD